MFTLQDLLQAILNALQTLFNDTDHRLKLLEEKLKDVEVNSDGRLQISTDVKFFGSSKTFQVEGDVDFKKNLRVRKDLTVDKNIESDSLETTTINGVVNLSVVEINGVTY